MIYIGKFARILFCRGGDQRSAMSFVHLVPIYSSDRLSHVIKTFFFYMRCRFRVRVRYFVLFFLLFYHYYHHSEQPFGSQMRYNYLKIMYFITVMCWFADGVCAFLTSHTIQYPSMSALSWSGHGYRTKFVVIVVVGVPQCVHVSSTFASNAT